MSSPSPSTEPRAGRLAERAVELLGGGHAPMGRSDLRDGASRAIELRLAGIFRLGLCTGGRTTIPAELDAELIHAERREVASDLSSSMRCREILRALGESGIRPVVLKGRALAERLWPAPWMRPAGDFDLLVDERSLARALPVLVRLGLRPRNGGSPGRFRPTPSGVVLDSTVTGFGVDLHARLFRSVGSGIDTHQLLSRARDASFLGESVRLLDPSDELQFLLVHAAAHGSMHPKWLLDLHAAAISFPRETWLVAAERARSTSTSRPFWAAARWVGGPDGQSPRELSGRLRPSPHVRAILGYLVGPTKRVWGPTGTQFRSYALEWFLEERLPERARRCGGLIVRLAGRWTPRRDRRGGRLSSAVVASDRWIEAAWRNGSAVPVWLTLSGCSMAPGLRDGDRLLVSPLGIGETPREGEVVIAKRAGRLVAHRLIAHTPDGVLTRGDACTRDDPPLPPEMILATVVAVDPRSIETR